MGGLGITREEADSGRWDARRGSGRLARFRSAGSVCDRGLGLTLLCLAVQFK